MEKYNEMIKFCYQFTFSISPELLLRYADILFSITVWFISFYYNANYHHLNDLM